MGGIAGPIQQAGQIPNQLGFGQQPGQVRPPGMPFYQNPNPTTNGAVNNNGVTAQTPMPQPFGQQLSPGVSANFRPEGYVSPYANYGFDPGFAQYLDNRYYNYRGMDNGQWNYDPTNQMFTNVGAMRAPGSGPDPTMSLANMQRTYEIQNQLRTMGPNAINNPEFMKLQNELFSIQNPGQTMPQFPPQKPGTYTSTGTIRSQPQTQPMNPQGPRPGAIIEPARPGFGGDRVYAGGNPNFDERIGAFINSIRPSSPQQPQQRGLGGLQLNKFRNRLG